MGWPRRAPYRSHQGRSAHGDGHRQGRHRSRAPAARRPRCWVPHRLSAPARARNNPHRSRRSAPLPPPQRGAPLGRRRSVGIDGRNVARRRGHPSSSEGRYSPHARGASSTRTHVASAHARRLVARSVRLESTAQTCCYGSTQRRRILVAVPPACRGHQHGSLERQRHRAARRSAQLPRAASGEGWRPRRDRRNPHLRSHRHRRSARPHTDAIAHGVTSLTQWLNDRCRRYCPSHRSACPQQLGRHRQTLARSQGQPGHRPQRGLPNSGTDHGDR